MSGDPAAAAAAPQSDIEAVEMANTGLAAAIAAGVSSFIVGPS